MFGNIFTSLSIIRCVYSNWKASSKETAKEGKEPFRGIEADQIDRSKLFTFESYERLSEFKALLKVLSEVYCSLSLIIFYPCSRMLDRESRKSWILLQSHFKLINQSCWL